MNETPRGLTSAVRADLQHGAGRAGAVAVPRRQVQVVRRPAGQAAHRRALHARIHLRFHPLARAPTVVHSVTCSSKCHVSVSQSPS